MKSKEGVAAAIVLLAITVLAPPLLAGDLDPPGPPAPTMKTLDQIPPTWDQTLQSSNSTTPDGCNSSRFKCVLAGTAVLDKETGLVWEKSPNTTPRNWDSAWSHCVQRTVGSRKGWRLPTIQELASLVDPAASNPALPAGHPFTSVQLYAYWSSTIYPYDGGLFAAWLDSGSISPYTKTVNTIYTWCVRGGRGSEGQ
jgi:hypothetical protein